jgi:hypothetical protein
MGPLRQLSSKVLAHRFILALRPNWLKKLANDWKHFFVAGSVLRVHVETASGGQSDGEDQQRKLHFPAIKIREICIIGESEQLVGQYCGGLPSSEG